jgi:D-alanyl-D-alanine carboxypeptidase (penicillin-binding protein 5/6)
LEFRNGRTRIAFYPLTAVPLIKCRSAEAVELYAAEPVSGYGHADDKVTYSFALPERVSATVKADAVLGQATVYLDGYEVGTVDLVTHQEYVSDFRTDLKSTLLLMAALVLLLAVLSCVTLVSGGSSLNRNRKRRANRK